MLFRSLKIIAMETIKQIHNFDRWAILILGMLALIFAIKGIAQKSQYGKTEDKISLFFMIFCDIQLLLGIILLYSSGYIDKIKSGMGEVMKNPIDRFYIVEHGFMMILAWVLVHVGRTAIKKSPLEKKHQKTLLFYGIALLIILISIPWSFRIHV